MRGDILLIRKYHVRAARKIAGVLIPEIRSSRSRYVVTVSGESGSGKTEIAHELARILRKNGIRSITVHQDDYFRYPPKTNYRMRREDMSRVGTKEVRLSLLNKHIKSFRDSRTARLRKPLVYFKEDRIGSETIPCKNAKVLIVDGTYAALLKGVDKKIFLSRTYKDTLRTRMARKREKIDAFDKKILAIEHRIISKHRKLAHITAKKDYSLASESKKQK